MLRKYFNITSNNSVSGTFTGKLPLSYYNTLGGTIVEKEEAADFCDGPVKNPGHMNQLQHFYPLVIKCVMDQDIKVIYLIGQYQDLCTKTFRRKC